MKTVPHTNRRTNQIQVQISWKLLLIQDARVHYVVLKQQPHTTHPTHTKCAETSWQGNQKQTNPGEKTPALLPQDPTVCQTQNHASPRPPFQNHHWLVLGKDTKTRGRYLLIFHP